MDDHNTEPVQGVKASQETRQRTIDALCEHFAADTIDLDEFEHRVDAAHRAETLADLRRLLTDLPTPGAAIVPAEPAATTAPVPTAAPHTGREIARPELVKDNHLSLVCRAIINSNEFAFLP